MDAQYLNEKAVEIHANNITVGWWDNPNQCLITKVQLIITEICEATEGERKNLMDDHLPHRKMGEVELADALIRTLDLGEYLGLTCLPYHIDPLFENQQPAYLHYKLVEIVTSFGRCVEYRKTMAIENLNVSYTKLVFKILKVAEILGYDLQGAMDEKLAYNKHRADHKREARAAAGGKQF